MFPSYNVID